MDEPSLIRAAQAGDAAAFGALVEQYYDTLYRFAYRWCGNRVDAEDVTQQACIKLARSLSQYRFEAAFSSWLYPLVINCAKDWRQSQVRHTGEALAPSADQAMPCAKAENQHYVQQVLEQLDQMGANYKETALLVYAEGLSHKEAAMILKVKESTVSWRLHEIRKQLQQLNLSHPGSWEVQS